MSGRDVFISWSGEVSLQVALAFKTWLEAQYDAIGVFVSDVSIEAGQRGMDEIRAALQDAKIALVVVTNESSQSAWVNYEAGAIGALHGSDGNPRRVVPVLVDLASPSDLKGPLSLQQAVTIHREGISKMLHSINTALGIAPDKAAQKLASGWSALEVMLDAARQSNEEAGLTNEVPERGERDMIVEILELVRELRRRDAADQKSGWTLGRSMAELLHMFTRLGIAYIVVGGHGGAALYVVVNDNKVRQAGKAMRQFVELIDDVDVTLLGHTAALDQNLVGHGDLHKLFFTESKDQSPLAP